MVQRDGKLSKEEPICPKCGGSNAIDISGDGQMGYDIETFIFKCSDCHCLWKENFGLKGAVYLISKEEINDVLH